MKDLVVEGREILEKFISTNKIVEVEEYEDLVTSNDVRVITDLPNLVVVIPRNYPAIRELMQDTKWVNLFTTSAFSRYQKQKYTMYFILLKKSSPKYNDKNNRKLAVIISPSGEYTCYDSSGAMIDIINVLKITGLSRTILKQMK